MVLDLLPYKRAHRVLSDKAMTRALPDKQICYNCADALKKCYEEIEREARSKAVGLRRVCLSCGREDNDNPICPVCKQPNWGWRP